MNPIVPALATIYDALRARGMTDRDLVISGIMPHEVMLEMRNASDGKPVKRLPTTEELTRACSAQRLVLVAIPAELWPDDTEEDVKAKARKKKE